MSAEPILPGSIYVGPRSRPGRRSTAVDQVLRGELRKLLGERELFEPPQAVDVVPPKLPPVFRTSDD